MSYKSFDGYETRENEQSVADEYKRYSRMIETIKGMCDQGHLLRKAVGEKTEFENPDEELYYSADEDENTFDYYLLDNGLHVYIKDERVIIQEDDLDFYEDQTRIDASGTCISFLLGANGGELPYGVDYFSQGKMKGNLPVVGTIRNTISIKDVLKCINSFCTLNEHGLIQDTNDLYIERYMQPSRGKELSQLLNRLYDKTCEQVNTKVFGDELRELLEKKLAMQNKQLSSLEAEESTISEAEALIDRQTEKEGQSIGED